jgi:hypothetical protein
MVVLVSGLPSRRYTASGTSRGTVMRFVSLPDTTIATSPAPVRRRPAGSAVEDEDRTITVRSST